MASNIKLYGGKAERFEEIKASLRHELGYDPTNSEVVGLLMATDRLGQREPWALPLP